jgi:hypothetical protein
MTACALTLLQPGETIRVKAEPELTLGALAEMIGERATVKIRKRPVNGTPCFEVEIHEERDGYGVNAYGCDEDLETATRVALRDLGEALEECSSVELPARHHERAP